MGWIIIVLFAVSALLFILSLMQKDRSKELEKQMENVSIQLMQELYQLKQKVKVLEEEFIVIDNSQDELPKSNKVLSRDDVLSMYEDGYSLSDIALITNKHEDDIEQILAAKGPERKDPS